MSEKFPERKVFAVVDPNKWLEPPVNHTLVSMKADGQYLKISYVGETEDGDQSSVDIFLNDHGQEVVRSLVIQPKPVVQDWGRKVMPPLSWWEKFLLYFDVYVLRRF